MKSVFKLSSLVFLFSLLSFSTSFAQFPFVDGYIVTNTRDTIHGKIKYTPPGHRSAKIVFHDMENEEKVKFKPFQIQGFHVNGETYESKIYDINTELTYGLGVFMKRLNNEGPLKLYEYWNTDKERGFTMTFLENDGDYLFEINYLQFKKQLVVYFEDFPQLQAKINRGAFKKKDLPKIVEEYNYWKNNW